MRWRRQGVSVAVAAMTVVAALAAAAGAQSPLGVEIQQADVEEGGSTQVVVSVEGASGVTLPASAFSVTEAGQGIDDVDVTPIEDAEQVERRSVLLVFDASGSTEGGPIEAARTAAVEFARTVADVGVDVGLVTFADDARLLQAPTDDVAAVVDAIQAVEAGGETALYDAVLVGARTLQNVAGSGSMVVFSDGADTVSTTTLQAAQAAAEAVDAAVSTVALETQDLDLPSLQQLAEATGGQLVRAANSDELGGAFGEVATSLTNQYVLTYTSQQATGEFDLAVTVTTDDGQATDTVALLSPRDGAAVGDPTVVTVGDPGIFANEWVLFGALGLLFVGLAIIVGLIVVPTGDQRVARTLERGLRVYRRSDGRDSGPATSGTLGQRAVQLVASVPKPVGYDDRTQALLDRAAWPLRATEFTTLRVLGVITGVLVGWGLFGHPLLGIVVGAMGWVLPRVILDGRVAARRAKFLSQLPDTLQLLAGALKAGYGILQGIDTIVKETSDPTSSEFRQVLTEARLGLPLDESLEAMAERIDSDDFRWVAVAITIQRRVGGNLAELLETVADTLREREMVRRQISALSAEGRLSAVILVALPVVLGLYMTVVNPEYIGSLLTATIGQLMIVGAIILMIVGGLWMRRLIDIDV